VRLLQRSLPGLTTSASSTTSTSCDDCCPSVRAFFAARQAGRSGGDTAAPRGRYGRQGLLGIRPRPASSGCAPPAGPVELRRAVAPHCRRAAVAIRVVGVAIRGAQELIALSQYRHIATNESTGPQMACTPPPVVCGRGGWPSTPSRHAVDEFPGVCFFLRFLFWKAPVAAALLSTRT
jgi:hypothetical protein